MASKIACLGLAFVGAVSGFSFSGVSSLSKLPTRSSTCSLSMSAGIGATKSVKPDDSRRGEGVFKGVPAGIDLGLVEAMNGANKSPSYALPPSSLSRKFGATPAKPAAKPAPKPAVRAAAKPAAKPAPKPTGRPGASRK